MLSTDQLLRILQEAALLLKHDIGVAELRGRDLSNREYNADELDEFKRDLVETGNNVRILMLEYSLNPEDFKKFLNELEFPVLIFRPRKEDGIIQPEIIHRTANKIKKLVVGDDKTIEVSYSPDDFDIEGTEITFLAITEYDHLVSDSEYTQSTNKPVS
ncbi:MAG TPA: hypothetical protein P5280_17255, partial [Cyclobacteriaceae bacterium]|nr:hypothetical protein [Cyclobacteriaceae bacterium]